MITAKKTQWSPLPKWRRLSLFHRVMVFAMFCSDVLIVTETVVAFAIHPGHPTHAVTVPSRNEATHPLKEPTPSTLQVAFVKGTNLTDAINGSASTPPAVTSVTASTYSTTTSVSTTASTTTTSSSTTTASASTTASATTAAYSTTRASASTSASASTTASATTPAAAAETVLNVRTAATATSPVQNGAGDNGSAASVVPDAEPTADDAANDTKNIMVNMLKSWFDHKGEGYRYGGGSAQGDDNDSPPTSKAASGHKSLFERWDEASEEQERVLEDAMRTERPYDDDDDDDGGSSSSSSVLAADQNTPSRWFVLLLSGNSTVAQMRRKDFAKYLKLNLAARLSLEYDEIQINRVLVVPPRLMVNVSVVPVSERASAAAAAVAAAAASSLQRPSSWSASRSAPTSDRARVEDDDPLHNLVETNATLMELSGEEYRVERFMSLKSQKPQSMEETAAVVSDRHADIDYFIYATVGPLCVVVVLGFLLYTACKYVRKHPVRWPWKRKFGHPSFNPQHRHRRMTDDCCSSSGGTSAAAADEMMHHRRAGSVNVIYSGEFEQSQQQQLSGSWLDDANFVPDDSLDRIRTPTLLRTAAAPPSAEKTFADMLQRCGSGGDDDEDRRQRVLRHHRDMLLRGETPGVGQCTADAVAAAVAAVSAQSPRLSRENKLRILGCKQSCLLLPAVQPAAADETTAPSQEASIARSSQDGGGRR